MNNLCFLTFTICLLAVVYEFCGVGPVNIFQVIKGLFRLNLKDQRALAQCVVQQSGSMEDKREFDNPFEDYQIHRDSDVINVKEGVLRPEFQEKVQNSVTTLLNRLDSSLEARTDPRDCSVYTGTTGIALFYYFAAKKQHNQGLLQTAIQMVEKCIPTLHGRRLSFLNGDAGPLALGAVLYHNEGNSVKSRQLVDRLMSHLPKVLDLKSDLPDEVLYGRAGYLYALLFINKHLHEEAIDSDMIRQVVSAILESGKSLAKSERRNVPLIYMWHEKHYLGAAHGISGILYMLLQARKYLSDGELNTLVKPTIDYLMGIRFPSGNFPSSLGNNSDRLIHWCHGAPGMVQLFGLAHEIFGDQAYLKVAEDCGEVVWKRGLLRKGYGICHGVAGNAYTFLYLYQLTNDIKHLHRASKFADWCTAYGKHKCRTPDRPLSLFEGLAGTIYMMIDIQDARNAKFPAYVL